MSVTTHSRRAGYLAALFLCALPGSGYGQTAAAKPPLYLVDVKRGGAVDPVTIAAIKSRLQQMGESVLALPEGAVPKSCDSGPCVLRMARGNSALAQGRLLVIVGE